MIGLEQVKVTIQGKRILSDVNLEIQDGEFVLICGESGCGKTTLTKLINGLILHFVREAEVEGTVTVDGKNIGQTPMYRIAELVGSVFQNPKTQFFHMNSNAELAYLQKFADRIIYMKDGHIEREYTPSEFQNLSAIQREQMGLRSIVPEQIQIPKLSGRVENADFEVVSLSSKRKKKVSASDFHSRKGTEQMQKKTIFSNIAFCTLRRSQMRFRTAALRSITAARF